MSGTTDAPITCRPCPMLASAADVACAATGAGILSPRRRGRFTAGLGGKVAAFFVAVFLLGGYLVSPLASAYAIRDAVATGDSGYLRDRIDWPSVKQTLKTSMTTYALGAPGEDLVTGASEAATVAKPGLWQRIKREYGRRVVDGMVESYVTPESLPKLFAYRESYHDTVGSEPVEPEAKTWPEKIAREWRRLKRAEFLSPTRFAVEVQDRYTPGKSIAGILELRGSAGGIGWHLVSLEVKGRRAQGNAAKAVTRAWTAMKQAALPVTAR
jgi:hypothetical protein